MSDEDYPEVETAEGPDPIDSLNTFDTHELDTPTESEKDFSRLREHRVGVVEIDGLTVRIEEPRSFEQALQLIDSTGTPEILVQRSIAILVTNPSPGSEEISSLTPWHKSLLATAALDWLHLDELFTDVNSLEELRHVGEDAFGD